MSCAEARPPGRGASVYALCCALALSACPPGATDDAGRGGDATRDAGATDVPPPPDGGCLNPDASDAAIGDGAVTDRAAEDVAADAAVRDLGGRDRVLEDAAGGPCPTCMVLINDTFCIDRYEASRPDADDESQGTLTDFARCEVGVMPWYSSALTRAEATAACGATGKRLCSPGEWLQACAGPQQTAYAYGDDYSPILCNGIDRFCRCGAGSSCEAVTPCPYPHCYNQAPPDAGPEAGACGADPHALQTGAHPWCTNGWGLFDMNGNVWELVEAGDGLDHYRGGAYNCIDSEALHRCDFDITSGIYAKGFRCCADPR